MLFQVGGLHDVAAQHAVPESRRETLDLVLNTGRHIERRTIRHMTVCPGNVATSRRPGRIENCRLSKKNEWPFRMPAISHRTFSRGDFLEGPSKMNRAGSAAYFARPWDGVLHRVVNFENCRTIANALQSAVISTWKPVARNLEELTRRDI